MAVELNAPNRGGKGDDIGWSIAGGFYPALAKEIATHYKFTAVPTSQPIKIQGFFPRAGERHTNQVVEAGWQKLIGERRKFAQERNKAGELVPKGGLELAPMGGSGTTAMTEGISWAANIIGGTVNKTDLSKHVAGKILTASKKFFLRGNHAWYETGLSEKELNGLVTEVVKYLSGMNKKASTNKDDAQRRAKEFVQNIALKYNEFEVRGAVPAIQEMVNTLAGKVISEKQLNDWTEDVFKDPESLAYKADAREEEWKAYPDKSKYGKPPIQDQVKASGYDLSRLIQEGDRTIEEIWDATEDLALTMAEGGHGIAVASNIIVDGAKQDLRLMSGLAPKTPFSWFHPVGKTNVEGSGPGSMTAHVKNLMLKTIDDPWNKLIRKIKEGQEWKEMKLDWERFMETTYGKQASSDARTSMAAIKNMVSQGILATGASFDDAGKIKLDEVSLGKVMAAEAPTYAKKGASPRKEKDRANKLMGFILHSLFAGPIAVARGKGRENINETRYGISFRVSEQNEKGEAWYAGVRLGHHLKGDAIFEFDKAVTEAKDGVFVIMGPNFSLALQVKDEIMTEAQARARKIIQTQMYSVNRGGSGSQLSSVNGATLSAVNTIGRSNFPTRLVFNPKKGARIFTDFLKTLQEELSEGGMEEKKAKTHGSVRKAMEGAQENLVFGSFKNFWALPYITVEDSLERIAHESAGWFDKTAEESLASIPSMGKTSGGPTGPGLLISG